MNVNFGPEDKVMRFFFDIENWEDGFHLIVVKLPQQFPENEYVYRVLDVNQRDGCQLSLKAMNSWKGLTIPLDYEFYQMQSWLFAILGKSADYDNTSGEMEGGFPIKSLEDIYYIELNQTEVQIPLRNAVTKKLFETGYTNWMFHFGDVTANILKEF